MAKPKSSLQVLLVDDSVLVRERLGELLETAEHVTVCGAAGGVEEALAIIAAAPPDVVILDLDLPDGNGLQVLHAVERMPLPAHVIILTMYPFRVFGQQCLAAGAACYLEKAGPIERVVDVINELGHQQAVSRRQSPVS
ncbi:MAG: response regulator transcription factor [Verrucomicrobia bacterium]|nr:response regulator transcription factor [Verrucomicrobiota bacterium]